MQTTTMKPFPELEPPALSTPTPRTPRTLIPKPTYTLPAGTIKASDCMQFTTDELSRLPREEWWDAVEKWHMSMDQILRDLSITIFDASAQIQSAQDRFALATTALKYAQLRGSRKEVVADIENRVSGILAEVTAGVERRDRLQSEAKGTLAGAHYGYRSLLAAFPSAEKAKRRQHSPWNVDTPFEVYDRILFPEVLNGSPSPSPLAFSAAVYP